MPKTQRKPSKPKLKQKQKQRQHQTVVVNVIQAKRRIAKRTPRRGGTTGAGGGGAGGGRGYSSTLPQMFNPTDFAPIVRNPELPPMFIRDSQLSLPTSLPPPVPMIDYPTPTELQAPREDIRPIISGASVMTERTPLSIDTTIPKRLIPPVRSVDLGEFNLGRDDFTYPAIFSPPRSGYVSPMENPLLQEVFNKAPKKRKTDLGGYTDEQKKEYKRLQQEENRQANFFIGREKKDLAKLRRELEVGGFIRAEPPKKRRTKIEMREARSMGLEDPRPKRPVGRPKKPFEQQKMGPG